jgi:hypothetical protein
MRFKWKLEEIFWKLKETFPTHPPYFLSRSEGRVYPATKIPYLHIFVTWSSGTCSMYKITVPVTQSTVLQFSAVLQRGHNNKIDPVKFTHVPAYKKTIRKTLQWNSGGSNVIKHACQVSRHSPRNIHKDWGGSSQWQAHLDISGCHDMPHLLQVLAVINDKNILPFQHKEKKKQKILWKDQKRQIK